MTQAGPRSAFPAVILISGRGSNMRVLLEAAATASLPVDFRAVLSDRADAAGLVAAQALGVATQVVPAPRGIERAAYGRELAAAIRQHAPRLLVLAGFMRILSPAFIEEFLGRMLNIHPSLLPLYRGLHTHARVLEAKESQHGASVHFVTLELDQGPVVIQGRLEVHSDDNEQSLATRVHKLEHRIYPQAVGWFATGRLAWNGGDIRLDGAPLKTPRMIEEQDS